MYSFMKTTVDLPEHLLRRAKVVAAQRNTTIKELMITGLDWALRSKIEDSNREAALARLKKGFHLGGKKPLTREQAHERH
jgi:hypothetical protein